jgi:hypothetical protein
MRSKWFRIMRRYLSPAGASASRTAKLLAHHGLDRSHIQLILALEVIVKEGFIDAGFLGNLLGARSGQAVLAEFANGGVEDAGAGLVGAFGLGAVWGRCGHT